MGSRSRFRVVDELVFGRLRPGKAPLVPRSVPIRILVLSKMAVLEKTSVERFGVGLLLNTGDSETNKGLGALGYRCQPR